MISYENVTNLINEYNIQDKEWMDKVSKDLKMITEQNESSNEPFRFKKIIIKKFAVPEYGGVRCEPNGRGCLIWGPHRTGKSTTYDALLYCLLGSKAVNRPINKSQISVILSNGAVDLEITRESKNPLLVQVGKETFKGAEAISAIKKYTGLDPEDYRTFRGLSLPQQIESDSILQLTTEREFSAIIKRFSSKKLSAHIRDFVDNHLNAIEGEIKKLGVQWSDMAYEEMEIKQRVSETKYKINQLKEHISTINSGEFTKVTKNLQRNSGIKKKLQTLETEFQQLWKEGIHLKGLIGIATHKYLGKSPEEVVENVLAKVACPVCESSIETGKVQSRIKSQQRCPLCNEHYSWEILDKAELKIAESEKVNEMRRRLNEIQQKKDRIEKEKKKLGFAYAHETIRRALKEERPESASKKAKDELRRAKDLLDNDKGDLEKLALAKRENRQKRTEYKNKKRFLNHLLEWSYDDEFAKKSEKRFEKAIDMLFKCITGAKTSLRYEKGEIYLVDKYGIHERKRKARDKYETSFAEKRVVEISMVLALSSLNQESRYYNIDFIILDDVLEGISAITWKSNLIEKLRTMNSKVQLICTSYDEQIKQLTFESETKLKIQTTLEEIW